MARSRPFSWGGFSYHIGGWQWYRQSDGVWETTPQRMSGYGWQVRDLDGWYLCGGGNEYPLGDSKGAARIGVRRAIALAAKAINDHKVRWNSNGQD